MDHEYSATITQKPVAQLTDLFQSHSNYVDSYSAYLVLYSAELSLSPQPTNSEFTHPPILSLTHSLKHYKL